MIFRHIKKFIFIITIKIKYFNQSVVERDNLLKIFYIFRKLKHRYLVSQGI